LPEIGTSSLDQLQEDMEAIGLGERDNRGPFCGHCFSRLDPPSPAGPSRGTDGQCPVCGADVDEVQPVPEVPQKVLAIYLAKRSREGLIVNLCAFAGIFLSLALSALLWFALPANWWRLASFAMLAAGSYYLARVVGYEVGVPIGSRSGRRLRDRRWREFNLQRERGR
jgi:hypothetical protein